MLYFWQMERDPLRETVAVAIDNIQDLQREVERQRNSIHKLQSLPNGVRMLTKAVEELQESMPTLARRAAKEAVAEDRRTRHRDWWSYARTYAALLSAGAAVGAIIVGLVLR